MHFFVFQHPTPTNFTQGKPINGYLRALWIERYRTPGAFEIEALVSSGLHDLLPIGSVISHIDTLDAGIVENIELSEKRNAEPVVKISGRTFDAWLDNRIVGANLAHGTSPTVPFPEYIIAPEYIWEQAMILINEHIQTSFTVDDEDSLNDDIIAGSDLSGGVLLETRTIRRGSLHRALMELLALEDLGIRVIRKNAFGVLGDATKSYFYIHAGIDKSNTVLFSSSNGDIESAEYLWSLQAKKNAALVQSRYVEKMVVYPGADTSKYNRRMMFVDASDLDGSLTSPPTGPALTDIRAKMTLRGQQALANQNEINITQMDVSSSMRYLFRKDYDIGDIVSVSGNYGIQELRRVVEFAEIEDENGESGHPTLAVLGEV